MTAGFRFFVWIASVVLAVLTGTVGKRWVGEIWEVALYGWIAIMIGLLAWIVIEWKRGT